MKGGTGKTTLAINMAERAHAAGLRPVLVDCDPHQQALRLCRLRNEPLWPVLTLGVSIQGADRLAALRTGGVYDFVICDMPGLESIAQGAIFSQVDLILSPTGPGSPDLYGVVDLRDRAAAGGWPVHFVPNHLPPGHRRRDLLLRELEQLEVRVCPHQLHRRVAHFDAMRYGVGVCEFLPRSVAAREVDGLWIWLSGLLGLPSQSVQSVAEEVRHA